MRILHTSDWHLGRSFHGVGLLDAQAAFVDHLIETVREQSVDLVVVAGDVYDRALPPVDAVALAHESLRRLAAERIRTVITSGNHDSAQRLGFAADLIDTSGVHLRTDPATVGTPVTIEGPDTKLAVYGLPYLEPDFVKGPWRLPERSHSAALSEGMRRVRSDLATRPTGTRSLVVAHAFVTGGQASNSERDISVGGVSNVGAEVFSGFDYVALGHLHGRQQLRPAIRYSGSPLAYSFSEATHQKGSWLVDLGPGGLRGVDFVAAPVPRRLGTISGRLDDMLSDPGLAGRESRWLKVTLTDKARPRDAMERLRSRFPHTLVVAFAPSDDPAGDASRPVRDLASRSDVEIAAEFVEKVSGSVPDHDEVALLRAGCDACRVAETAAS